MLLYNQGSKISKDGLAGKRSLLFVKAFRMPLYAQNGKAFMNDRFRAEILWAVLYDMQACSRSANRLMVGAVDDDVGAAQTI